MMRIIMMVLKNFWFVPWAWVRLCRYARHPERYPEEKRYRHIQEIMHRAVVSGKIDLQVTGLENIPQEGGFMFYSNHQGMFDSLAVAATCPRPFGAVFKKELYHIPFLYQIARCTQSYGMDREDARQALTVIRAVTEEVLKGRCYLIFPEGTRNRSGNALLDFHSGSFRCALKSKCPVIPIALIDCFKVLDEKGCGKVAMQLHYLPPIPYEEYKDMKTTELAALVKSRIEERIAACT